MSILNYLKPLLAQLYFYWQFLSSLVTKLRFSNIKILLLFDEIRKLIRFKIYLYNFSVFINKANMTLHRLQYIEILNYSVQNVTRVASVANSTD